MSSKTLFNPDFCTPTNTSGGQAYPPAPSSRRHWSKISFLPTITAPGPAQTKDKVMHAPDSLDSQNSFSGFEDIFQKN